LKAIILNDFDSEPSISDVAVPEVGAKELLVRVHASSVNGFDLSVASGAVKDWMPYELPVTLGRDYAGVVEAVGDDVTGYEVGDEVFGFVFRDTLHDGTWAEYVVVPDEMFVSRKPASVPLQEAGALPLAGVAAMKAVEGVVPTAGDRVLVVGATGGAGGFAVQLLAASGAHVIATTTPDDEERLSGLGAAETIDFTSEDVVASVRERYPDGVDALLDFATPGEEFSPVSDLVRSGGRVATTTGAGDAEALATREIETTSVWATAEPETLSRLAAYVDRGELTVTFEDVFSLDRAGDGLDAFKRGTHGKIGIAVAG
jgi:NADPH:quinone reductase-like Zn-dependent oxidoreductase